MTGPGSGAGLDRGHIERLLPQRAPYLLLDRVTSFEAGSFLEAQRQLAPGDPVFEGHFPGLPLLPGVLLFETMAQAAAVLFLLTYGPLGSGELPVLGSVDARVLAPVFPGQLVSVRIESERMISTAGLFRGVARVEGRTVARGRLSLAKAPVAELLRDAPPEVRG